MSNGREIVVRRRGDTFAFVLPEGHEFELLDSPDDEGRALAHIRVPGVGGQTCTVIVIEDRDEEIEYELEPAGTSHSVGEQPPGYPWPTVQEEHARLRRAWDVVGGRPTDFDAWAKGASHESQFREWRAEIRKLRRSERSS